jgi:S-DNA-T family DNA segregation ATPase FtsK/SpoIIIE
MAGRIGDGARHLRAEWGRWRRTEDLTDTHIAHKILNDQYRLWRGLRQQAKVEVTQNIKLLKDQQRQQTYMQMQRMQMMRRGGGRGYGGYGLFGGMGGASPIISYRMMQWAQLQMRIGQQEFRHLEVTDSMLQVGRGQVRRTRGRAALAWMVGLLAVWVAVWWAAALAGLALTAAALALYVLTAWVQGRHPTRRRPPVPKLMFVPMSVPDHTELAEEPEPEPFPIREAGRDPRRARESVALALRKERAQVADVAVPTETDWGWTVPVTLSGGTLGDLIKILPKMATTLRVGDNRLLAQRGDAEDSAAVKLRVLLSDPFGKPAPPPARAPLSATIIDPVSIGISIDGEATPVVLAGQHVLIVSDTGGGKSTMVRTMAEYATACRDCAVVDIDPTGRGLGPLGPCAALRALNPADAERLLERLLAKAEARIAALGPIDDNWRVTPDSPAIIAFVDEWPRLSKRAKTAALALLRIGRKARITLVVCTQDATSDVLGDAVADTFGVRIMLPCRQADVPLVVGMADAISRGWLPHLLIASPGEWEPADAGRFYCITPRHRTPILRYVSPIDAATAAARAKERVAAGLPPLDDVTATGPRPGGAPEIAMQLLAIFATHGDPEALTVAQIAERLVAADPSVWGRWEDRADRVAMIGRTLKAALKKSGLAVATVRLDSPGRPTAYRLADIHAALKQGPS